MWLIGLVSLSHITRVHSPRGISSMFFMRLQRLHNCEAKDVSYSATFHPAAYAIEGALSFQWGHASGGVCVSLFCLVQNALPKVRNSAVKMVLVVLFWLRRPWFQHYNSFQELTQLLVNRSIFGWPLILKKQSAWWLLHLSQMSPQFEPWFQQ